MRLHWRETFGTNIDERSRHIERETFKVWDPSKGRMVSDSRVKDHGEQIYSATMNQDPTQVAAPEAPVTVSVPAAPSAPTQASAPKPGQSWVHSLQGSGEGGIAFVFNLERHEDGQLKGSYSVKGGRAWSLRGSLSADGRVVLEGQENGARFEGSASYEGQQVKLNGQFQNKLYRTALEVAQVKTAVAEQFKPEQAAEEVPASESALIGEGTPDALDALLSLKGHLRHYSIAQIRAARQAIEKLDDNKQHDLYLLLQTKTPYHNQRNNQSIGRAVDELNTPFGPHGKRIGAKIADVMCNLTSLSMALETLGIENPKPKEFPQFEDYLEDVRRQYVDRLMDKEQTQAGKNRIAVKYHREQNEGWKVVAEEMGAEVRTLFWRTAAQARLVGKYRTSRVGGWKCNHDEHLWTYRARTRHER